MKFLEVIKLGAVAGAFALAATTADAVTVKFYDTTSGGDTLIDTQVGVLTGSAVGGYTASVITTFTGDYPPLDFMSSTLNLNTCTGNETTCSARIEVSHQFDAGLIPTNPALGESSASNNFDLFTGSVQTDVYLASSLFGQDTLLSSAVGVLTSDKDTVSFDPTDYFITYVFSVSGGSTKSHTANAEWAAPLNVPVPAGILLMGTAIAGFGVMRRRKLR